MIGRRLLVDVSGYAYAAAYKLGDLTHKGQQTGVVYGVLRSLMHLAERHNPSEIVICWDGGHEARSKMFPDYKAHRHQSKGEDWYQVYRKQCDALSQALKALPVVQLHEPGVEADDIIGALCAFLQHERVAIATSDKDLYQLARPDQHVIINARTSTVDKLDLKPVEYLWYKVLVGDPSDNIPGVNRVGDKTARALFAEHGSLKAIMRHAKAEDGLGSDSYDEVKETVERNLKLMTPGLVLTPEQRWRILDNYKRDRLRLKLDASAFKSTCLRYGLSSFAAKAGRLLLPFYPLQRGHVKRENMRKRTKRWRKMKRADRGATPEPRYARKLKRALKEDEHDAGNGVRMEPASAAIRRRLTKLDALQLIAFFRKGEAWRWLKQQGSNDLEQVKIMISLAQHDDWRPTGLQFAWLQSLQERYLMEAPEWMGGNDVK